MKIQQKIIADFRNVQTLKSRNNDGHYRSASVYEGQDRINVYPQQITQN